MRKWCEWLQDSGSGNDENVWGFKKVAYHFSDLKEWLEEKEKGKEKQKVVKKKKTEEKGSKVVLLLHGLNLINQNLQQKF